MEGLKYMEFNGMPVVSARELYAFLTGGTGQNVTAWLIHCRNHWMMEQDADFFEVETPAGHNDCLLVVTAAAVMCTGIPGDRAKEVHTMLRRMISAEIPNELNNVTDNETWVCMNEAAKILGMGQQALFKFLIELRILMSSNIPYQNYINGGYFKVRRSEFRDHSGKVRHYAKTFVTKEGLEWLEKIIEKNKQKLAA